MLAAAAASRLPKRLERRDGSGGGGKRADAGERFGEVRLPRPAGGQLKLPAAGVIRLAPDAKPRCPHSLESPAQVLILASAICAAARTEHHRRRGGSRLSGQR
jgi:hypothetical protein